MTLENVIHYINKNYIILDFSDFITLVNTLNTRPSAAHLIYYKHFYNVINKVFD